MNEKEIFLVLKFECCHRGQPILIQHTDIIRVDLNLIKRILNSDSMTALITEYHLSSTKYLV